MKKSLSLILRGILAVVLLGYGIASLTDKADPTIDSNIDFHTDEATYGDFLVSEQDKYLPDNIAETTTQIAQTVADISTFLLTIPFTVTLFIAICFTL